MKQVARRDAPPSSFLDGVLRRLRDLAGRGEVENAGLRETLEELIEEAEEGQAESFTTEQRALLFNALSFGEVRVDDVMVPRADLAAVSAEAPLATVVKMMQSSGHSRLLVFRETLDDILGIVHVKDLLPFWGDGAAFDLTSIVRPVLVVPPSMRVIDLLLEMRDQAKNVAIVVDEFGGTDGIVTVEDLVQELLGELQDNREQGKDGEIADLGNGHYEADARVDLEDLEERLKTELLGADERDEADTLAGLIYSLVDRVPQQGETIVHPSGWRFTVVDGDARRIKRVRIEHAPSGEGAALS
ncbi:CBS domain-containing protein [Arboricoccus pini]|uniref:CBS domain-containing protein n=1 Tax=Arboricoccus pini TaxID=1963835 RepID=A0A212PYK3_9PROT|nr:hemolysin family protein [Arboricoccus pini]SNB52069.1 CBS domain-containing protein [Arboricoccus pini]